jgi:putative Holliday junction resolvase
MPEPRPPAAASAPRIILALDYGLRRIGLAAGDTLTGSARPQRALTVATQGGPGAAELDAIGGVVRALAPSCLVVGCPYNVDGSPGALTTRAREFAAVLAQRFGLPVHLVDERYSSLEAVQELRTQRAGGGRRRRIEKTDVDSAAAAVILERWLAGEGDR